MFRHTPLISAVLFGTSMVLVQGVLQAQSPEDVAKLAQAISVKIQVAGQDQQGSGVILQKQGDLYTVLTAAHVVKSGKSWKLTTAIDDRNYEVIAGSMKRSNSDIDLAVVQFRSSQNYQVAKIGNSNLLKSGMELYVAGYPVPTATITQSIWVFREGKVTANSDKVFKDGYSLIYSNSTLPGMSGGAVLNRAGELVGIHGKGDRSADSQKTDFNLGIPVNRFGEVAKSMGVQLGVEIAKVPTNSAPKADDYFVSANNKYTAGNYQGALAEYDRAIALNPNYISAYSNRGLLRSLRLNDQNGALADYNKAIALDPKYATAYNNRGLLRSLRLNDQNGALADYNKAIALDPKYAIAHYNRGFLKEDRLKDYRGALADYNQAISIDPQYLDAYNNRGLLKDNKLNDLQGSLADYNRVISLDPKYAIAYNNRALLKAEKLKDLQGALADYNQAISLNPKYSEAHNNRAVLKAEKLNDYQGALADYNQAISLDPRYASAYNSRGLLKQNNLNDLPGALADHNQAIALNSQNANFYASRGILKSYKLNDFQGGLSDYNAAIAIDAQFGAAYYHRGVLKKNKLNDRTGAIGDFRTAIKIIRQRGGGEDLQYPLKQLQELGAVE
jgi:tetratricopeptide (TPR) repeat protein